MRRSVQFLFSTVFGATSQRSVLVVAVGVICAVGIDGGRFVSAKGGCTCDSAELPGCQWIKEEVLSNGSVQDPLEDECFVHETLDSYGLSTAGARLFGSHGFAYRDCLGTSVARARKTTQSRLELKFTLTQRCGSCLGRIKAEFRPEVHLAAWAFDPHSHATIAASMAAKSSVADMQERKTSIFPGLLAEASSKSTEATVDGISISIPIFSLAGWEIQVPVPLSWSTAGDLDTASIRIPKHTRWYTVGPATAWEIEFSYLAGIGVDVWAEQEGLHRGGLTAEAVALSGDGTWRNTFSLDCTGGCWSTANGCESEVPGQLTTYSIQGNTDAVVPDASALRNWRD